MFERDVLTAASFKALLSASTKSSLLTWLVKSKACVLTPAAGRPDTSSAIVKVYVSFSSNLSLDSVATALVP